MLLVSTTSVAIRIHPLQSIPHSQHLIRTVVRPPEVTLPPIAALSTKTSMSTSVITERDPVTSSPGEDLSAYLHPSYRTRVKAACPDTDAIMKKTRAIRHASVRSMHQKLHSLFGILSIGLGASHFWQFLKGMGVQPIPGFPLLFFHVFVHNAVGFMSIPRLNWRKERPRFLLYACTIPLNLWLTLSTLSDWCLATPLFSVTHPIFLLLLAVTTVVMHGQIASQWAYGGDEDKRTGLVYNKRWQNWLALWGRGQVFWMQLYLAHQIFVSTNPVRMARYLSFLSGFPEYAAFVTNSFLATVYLQNFTFFMGTLEKYKLGSSKKGPIRALLTGIVLVFMVLMMRALLVADGGAALPALWATIR